VWRFDGRGFWHPACRAVKHGRRFSIHLVHRRSSARDAAESAERAWPSSESEPAGGAAHADDSRTARPIRPRPVSEIRGFASCEPGGSASVRARRPGATLTNSSRFPRGASILVVGSLFSLLAACRNPVPPPPKDQPGIKPTPDAGLPGNEEPSIEPDTGNPLGPGGREPVAPAPATGP
jgi:hypothetical protein